MSIERPKNTRGVYPKDESKKRKMRFRSVSRQGSLIGANNISAGTEGHESEAVLEEVQPQIQWKGKRPEALDDKQNKIINTRTIRDKTKNVSK